MPKFSFYAVYPGWRPGIYRDWGRAEAASSGHPQDFSNHKGFHSWNDAVAWYLERAGKPPEYMEWYRVSVGEIPSKQIRIEEFSQQNLPHIKISASAGYQAEEHVEAKERVVWLGGEISSQDIGRWGEEYAFVALQRKFLEDYHNKYPEVAAKELQDGCVIYSNGQTLVEIHWRNMEKETSESPDIRVVVDEIEKYFEVKSTTSYDKMNFTISEAQWRLAEEKGEQFCILRVCGVGTIRATVYEIWNPYELWMKGKLTIEGSFISPTPGLQLSISEAELGKPDAIAKRRELQQRAGKTDRNRYVEGIGRRKTATARVRLYTDGTGSVVINHKPGREHFSRDGDLDKALKPLQLVNYDQMDVSVMVKGGGMTGQAEAIRLGIARALLKLDSNLRNQLRQAGFLTRDARVKERKKPGLKRARKAPQYTKR